MAEDTPETTALQSEETQGPGKVPSKVASQMTKLRDANAKYKSLLKMAKERIQAQEEEMEALKEESQKLRELVEADASDTAAAKFSMDEPDTGGEGETSTLIAKVYQRIRVEDGDADEIWALLEFEVQNLDLPDPEPPKRYKRWQKFETESALKDFIRRDTGEPLTLPPYSLSPNQSSKIEENARQSVSQVTEEFRRFRVRSEVQRKQADAQIRDLQSSNVRTAKRRIEGEDLEKELEQARTDHAQLELLKTEMAAQEAQWKEAYDVLMAENSTLKSSGSEALLAAQWRQRYETCLAEKEDLSTRLQMEVEKSEVAADQRRKVDAGKYEMKYRDLKESFRLYRKKAKEIFEAQQRGDVGLLNVVPDGGTEEAKLSYLKNLMVNYLSSDHAVKEHMEGAIGTILKFSDADREKIEKKKLENEAWLF